MILALAAGATVMRDSLREHRGRAFARAAWNGNVWQMRFLHLLGASPNDPGYGTSPPVISAAMNGKTEAVRYLLDHGGDVNQRDKYGFTPLIAAASGGHMDAVQYLLKKGAIVNEASEDGSALTLALRYSHSEVADVLRHYGGRECWLPSTKLQVIPAR